MNANRPRPTSRLAAILLFAAAAAWGNSTIGPTGPPAQLRVISEQHLFDVIVTPPRASAGYQPGQIKVFLIRHYPEYLMVELVQETLSNGDRRVHFALTPQYQDTFFIRVSDLQNNGEWMTLNDEVSLREIPHVEGRVSTLP